MSVAAKNTSSKTVVLLSKRQPVSSGKRHWRCGGPEAGCLPLHLLPVRVISEAHSPGLGPQSRWLAPGLAIRAGRTLVGRVAAAPAPDVVRTHRRPFVQWGLSRPSAGCFFPSAFEKEREPKSQTPGRGQGLTELSHFLRDSFTLGLYFQHLHCRTLRVDVQGHRKSLSPTGRFSQGHGVISVGGGCRQSSTGK